jgi:hypothetical protein
LGNPNIKTIRKVNASFGQHFVGFYDEAGSEVARIPLNFDPVKTED